MRIILSRTDSIGDVVLTLPMAGALKEAFPGCTVIFLVREYTRPVVELSGFVDEIAIWAPSPALPQRGREGPHPDPPPRGREDEGTRVLSDLKADVIIHVFPVKEICVAAKRAGIRQRVATAGRFFTWLTCNRLLFVPRKNSYLHESQLNLKLLRPLGVKRGFDLQEIPGLYGTPPLSSSPKGVWKGSGKKLILHPKSKGSAREWGLENFSKLIELLPAEKFEIIITGTKEEGALMAGFLAKHRNRVTDMTGKLTLDELIELIRSAHALVAASTGPLHLAAALGIRAVGLYAPMRPIFPKRWAPVGINATYLVLEKTCSDCRKNMDCHCIRSITPESVLEKLTTSEI